MIDSNLNRLSYEQKEQKIFEEYNLLSKNHSISLKKNTSNLFRNRKNNKTNRLDVRSFNQVISIDRENQLVETEAMITYEELVHETLKEGFLPAVVPELKSITIGGALAGGGIEASSFRYGLVHETITEMEILTGNGEIILCKPDNDYSDLFFGFANTFGSFGYILKIKAKLIPVKKYVRLKHLHFTNAKTFFSALKETCENNRDQDLYIEGTIFNRSEMHITVGEFVDQAPYTNNYKWMHPYYQSIRRNDRDFLTTVDFIWRWDPDWFWCSKHFGMNYSILRFLFGKFILKSTAYWKLMHLANSNRFLAVLLKFFQKPSESVIQDILIPIDRASEFLEFLFEKIGITPIWACPYKAYKGENPFQFLPTDPSILYIDFGFWDTIPSNLPRGTYNKLIEKKTKELNGFKSLYSDSFYTEKEFWEIFPQSIFIQLKNKYDLKNSLKTMFEKCVTKDSP